MRRSLRTLRLRLTRRRRRTEVAASSVEYGLLIALIAAVIVVAVIALGGVVKGAFTDSKTQLCSNSAKGSAQTTACTS